MQTIQLPEEHEDEEMEELVVMHLHLRLIIEDEDEEQGCVVEQSDEVDANECLFSDTQALVDIISLDELNTYVTDTAYTALHQAEH